MSRMRYTKLPYVLLLALVATAAACGPNIAQQFDKAKGEGTIAALDEFESKHPDHSYKDEIAQLKDDIRFKEAQSEGSLEAMQKYLEDFPEGKHNEEAKVQLDDLAWAAAQKKDTAEAYKAYLDQFEKGNHAGPARVAMGKQKLAAADKLSAAEIASWLKEKGIPLDIMDRGYRLLAKKVGEEAGDAGHIKFAHLKRGKMVGFSWVTGYAASKSLELDPAKTKVPANLTWKAKGKGAKLTFVSPEFKGNLGLKLIGELPEEQVSLVAVLKVAGKSYLASERIKLDKKGLAKKKAGTVKSKLTWQEPPSKEGKAKLYLVLVEGEVPSDATALKPISNVVMLKTTVQVPPEARKPEAKEPPAETPAETPAKTKEEKPAAKEDMGESEEEKPAAKEDKGESEEEKPAAKEDKGESEEEKPAAKEDKGESEEEKPAAKEEREEEPASESKEDEAPAEEE